MSPGKDKGKGAGAPMQGLLLPLTHLTIVAALVLTPQPSDADNSQQ